MKKIIAAIVVLAIIAAGGYYYYLQKQVPTADSLSSKLVNSSELTTQKLLYEGVVENEGGKIPILTKDSFLLVYKATVRAGFDVSKAEFDISDDAITVTIPKSEIQEITIDPDSLRTYNTSITIIKPDEKDMMAEALKAAEKDANEKAKDSGLLEAADENAESIIKALLEDDAHGREIVVKHK
jgi:hypothetical protein